MYNEQQISDMLRGAIGNERILWYGRPNKTTLILESIFNRYLYISIIWLLIECYVFSNAFTVSIDENPKSMAVIIFFVIFLIVFSLAPFLIYIGRIITTAVKYKNKEYAITDRGIYLSDGLFYKRVYYFDYSEFRHISVHRGFIDYKTGVGDIYFYYTNGSLLKYSRAYRGFAGSFKYMFGIGLVFYDISDYNLVSSIIAQKINNTYINNSQNVQNRVQYNAQPNMQNRPQYNAQPNVQNRPHMQYQNSAYAQNRNINQQSRYYPVSSPKRDEDYNLNGGNNEYDSWDNKNKKNDRDSWD